MPREPIPVEPYIEKLEQAILIGATYELAAMYAGISEATFGRWRKAAETAEEGTPLANLRERLRQAEGRAAVGWLAKIEKVANEGDWKACAWKLERRWPETYGRTFNKVAFTDASGEHDAALQIAVTNYTLQSGAPAVTPLLPEHSSPEDTS